MSATSKLYTPQVLALATALADYPLYEALKLRGAARSSICGSALELGLELDASARIVGIGMKASACAIGQAAAALFAQSAKNCSKSDVQSALAQIEAWLIRDRAELPDWRGLVAIANARDYPGRHGAIVLPWKAALAALP